MHGRKGEVMKKKFKTTEISFNEADPTTTIYTYNTKLKKRLLEFSEKCPDLCKVILKDEDGCIGFEINKDNFTFRCMKPASDEKREKARKQMNKLIGKSTEANATLSELKLDCKTCKNRCEIGKLMLPISKQEKGCTSVTDFHPYHICRQSRQNKEIFAFFLCFDCGSRMPLWSQDCGARE